MLLCLICLLQPISAAVHIWKLDITRVNLGNIQAILCEYVKNVGNLLCCPDGPAVSVSVPIRPKCFRLDMTTNNMGNIKAIMNGIQRQDSGSLSKKIK